MINRVMGEFVTLLCADARSALHAIPFRPDHRDRLAVSTVWRRVVETAGRFLIPHNLLHADLIAG
jgi:hypothetical protein